MLYRKDRAVEKHTWGPLSRHRTRKATRVGSDKAAFQRILRNCRNIYHELDHLRHLLSILLWH